jgi:SAM-dependent methyltransferase
MAMNEQHTASGDPMLPSAAEDRLRVWYDTDLGRTLLAAEREALDAVLPDLFGYYLVQVGLPCNDYLLGASLIRRQVVIGDTLPGIAWNDERVAHMRALPCLLPLRNDSVDVVLLPHTLDFEHAAHDVLREAERVLVPEGHMVILGFNPWSLWGLRRMFTWHRRRTPPWSGSFRGSSRIRDWLALLGFDLVLARSCFFRPPMRKTGLMRRLQWLEALGARRWPYFGGTYIIVARKRVATLTPIKPRWRPRRSLVGAGAIKPTA